MTSAFADHDAVPSHIVVTGSAPGFIAFETFWGTFGAPQVRALWKNIATHAHAYLCTIAGLPTRNTAHFGRRRLVATFVISLRAVVNEVSVYCLPLAFEEGVAVCLNLVQPIGVMARKISLA